MRVEKRLYAGHWPIWCLVKDGVVLCCRKSEAEAIEEMEKMK